NKPKTKTLMNGDLRHLSGRIKLVLDGKRARAAFVRGAGWLGVLAVMLLAPGAAPAQTIRLISSPGKFYVDDKAGNGIVYNYAAYTISNNTGVTLPSVYVAITNIVSTNRVTLASVDSGARALGALAPGQTKMAAFYLKGPSFT